VTEPIAAPAMVPAATPEELVELIGDVGRIVADAGRSDLGERLAQARSRLQDPTVRVVVVGEFKQGKSSLVNALLGQPVCPVDDDLATSAITLIRYGEEPGAVVRMTGDDGQATAAQVPIDELGNWVSEVGNPGNAKHVERVDVAVNSPMLKQGLVIVDTPGMGGLGAGHAAATLGFLPFADGLILVSDASAELSAAELQFLKRATELCPTVVFAQSKADLYPSAGRIRDLNQGHLSRAGLELPVVITSAAIRAEALTRRDRDLNERSGIPALVQLLSERIVGPAKANAESRSRGDAAAISAMVRTSLESERAALADPEAAKRATASFEAAKQRLEHLRGPAARWSTVVNDRVGDLSNNVNYELRGAMRTISRNMDELIEGLNSGEAWDDMTRDLQSDVADEVTNAFVALEQGRVAIRDEVIALLGEEDLGLTDARGIGDFDVESLWGDKALDGPVAPGKKRALDKGLTGIRGAQSGVMMFGMLGQFLPRAAGALLATNPVLLGVGAVFGGMSLSDDRKRKVAARRQAARGQVRQFLDDVQFEVGNQISGIVRDLQRDLRDEFTERLTELQRTCTDSAKRAQEDVQRTQAERAERGKEIDTYVAFLTKVEAALAGPGPGAA
jgi:hypothetical protein